MSHWADMQGPVVSICCATYNHENYIADALDSFLMQETRFPFEVIVRDDCSTDRTADIIREYCLRYPNLIKPIYETENQFSKGVSPTLTIIGRAAGRYFALCEGDDYWTDSRKLELQISALESNPGVNLSFHPAKEIVDTKLTGKIWGPVSFGDRVIDDLEMIRSIGKNYCPTAAMVIRREVILPTPEFFHRVPAADDFIQFLGSVGGGAIFFAEKMAVYRRGVPGSWTSRIAKDDAESAKLHLSRRDEHMKRYVDSLIELADFVDPKYRVEFDRRISQSYFARAVDYLNIDDYDNFRRLVEESRNWCSTLSLFSGLVYHVRYLPYVAKQLCVFRRSAVVRMVRAQLQNAIKR